MSKSRVPVSARTVDTFRDHMPNSPSPLFNLSTPVPPAPKPLLQRANELIGGDRQQDYGDKLQNFAQIAMLWQGVLATKLIPGTAITPEDIALCMIQVKIARLAKSPDHEDSILDVAGYAGCYEALQLERATGLPLAGVTHDARQFHELGS